jgi:hypothetical protein
MAYSIPLGEWETLEAADSALYFARRVRERALRDPLFATDFRAATYNALVAETNDRALGLLDWHGYRARCCE